MVRDAGDDLALLCLTSARIMGVSTSRELSCFGSAEHSGLFGS